MSYKLAFAALGLFFIAPTAAQATFIVDVDPGGDKFLIDKPDDPTTTFTGNVGDNLGPLVTVETDVLVTTGNGYSNIKPDQRLVLTSLVFTPDDPLLFTEFSFQGQLDAAGDVTVTVQDAQGNPAQVFVFAIPNANQNFDRIGIISIDGQTIQSVTISNASFKEVKQIDFAPSGVAVPEASTLAIAGVAGLGVAVGSRRRRRRS